MNASCAQKLLKFVGDPGRLCEFGCKESETKGFTKLARKMYPEKGICIVSAWMILDFKKRRKKAGSPLVEDVSRSVLYSGCVELDFSFRFSRGRRVITTPVVDMKPPCFIITLNTVYILLGEGSRKDVNPELINAVHF